MDADSLRAAQVLDEYEQGFARSVKAGTPSLLMVFRAMDECAKSSMPWPRWVASAFDDLIQKIELRKCKTWDELLGPLYRKGQHVDQLRKQDRLAAPVRSEVYRRTHDADGRRNKIPKDDELFEAVGEIFRIKATTVKKYCKHWDDFAGDAPEDIAKNLAAITFEIPK